MYSSDRTENKGDYARSYTKKARKLEKKLREIAALEQSVDQGKSLDALQLQKAGNSGV